MNLTLGLSGGIGVGVARTGGVETSIARFEQWMADADAPVRAIRHQPARVGEFAEIPAGVATALRQTLEARGIPRLYTHQAEAFQLCADSKNVVVVTPTASGKTLCYNLPVLQRLVEDRGARAIDLFPPKPPPPHPLHEFQAPLPPLCSH